MSNISHQTGGNIANPEGGKYAKRSEVMIQNFSCKNFRNITAENLSFEKINILIGPNKRVAVQKHYIHYSIQSKEA